MARRLWQPIAFRAARAVFVTLVPALSGGARLTGQERSPLPDASARSAAHDAFLDALAQVSVTVGPGTRVIEALMSAATSTAAPAVRLLLLEHAERCARAAGDVPAALAVADATARTFVVEPGAARAACLARFEAEARVAAQVLVGARLDEAERCLEEPADAYRVHLEVAKRLAASDRPAGLADWVQRRTQDLDAARQAFLACAAAPADAALRGRYETLFRARWPSGLAAMQRAGGRPGRVANAKLGGSDPDETPQAQAHTLAAEQWLSQSAREIDPVAQRNLQRRALQLLAGVQRLPEVAAADPLEERRRAALLDCTMERLAALATPGVDTLRFGGAEALARLRIVAGEWRQDGELLVGRNTGEATRATTPFAWRAIDAVRIRGGIRSAGTLNFRVGIGDVNLLLNWEVADENHIYVGDACVRTAPRRLLPGREHCIDVRQVAGEVVVCVDGELLAAMAGALRGTVSVYPALGSEIFVRSIDVVGDLDLGTVARGPSHMTR